MTSPLDRRSFVKGSLAAGLSLAAGAAQAQPQTAKPAASAPAAGPAPAGNAASFPHGKIGDLSVSRLLLGGNLLSRYNHYRDLKYVEQLCQHYLTDEKILETLALCEAHGVDTLSVHFDPNVMSLIKKHRASGGRMKWILHTKVPPAAEMKDFTEAVRSLADDGADALYLWGVHGDMLVAKGQVDLIARAVEAMKLTGLQAGVGGHDLAVVEACEKAGVPNDFYVKTFHHHNYPSAPRPDELTKPVTEVPGYWCRDPEKTIEVMQNVKKPWIAYKVMAAGAIPAENAFRWAFKNGADFVLAGMFDFEVAKDAALIRTILGAELPRRPRPWLA